LVRPLKSQVEELLNRTHVLQLQQRDTSTHVAHLQALLAQLDADHRDLKAKFGGEDKGPNLHQSVADLEAKVKKHQNTLWNVEETIKDHNESRTQHDRRIDRLEDHTSILQQQTRGLQDQVGVDPPAATPKAVPQARSQPQTMVVPEPKSAKNMGALMKFQSAVNQMSVKERLREYKKRLDGHDQDLAGHIKKWQDQKFEMELKGQRVSVLEKDLANANKVIDELKAGLELTEEYWKGLSGGFRETHKTVNINNELLPSPTKGSVTLPSLQTPRSARGSLR